MPVIRKAAAGPGSVTKAIETTSGPVALVRAVIVTGIGQGVVDHQGDAYDPGAFGPAGQKVLLSPWNHSSYASGGAPPVGAGVIREVGTEAIFTGELWLKMSAARDVHHVLLQRGTDQEWSYVLGVTKGRMNRRGEPPGHYIQSLVAWEASPVWRGAGIGTHTVSVVDDQVDAATRAELDQIAARVLNNDKSNRAALEAVQLRMIERSHRARMRSRR